MVTISVREASACAGSSARPSTARASARRIVGRAYTFLLPCGAMSDQANERSLAPGALVTARVTQDGLAWWKTEVWA